MQVYHRFLLQGSGKDKCVALFKTNNRSITHSVTYKGLLIHHITSSANVRP